MNYDFELNDEQLLNCIKYNKLNGNTKINNLLKMINLLKEKVLEE